jgi:hypothetical protein
MAFSCCGLVCEIGISLTTYYRRRTLDCGSQTLRRSRTGPDYAASVTVADLNGDGKLDLAVPSSGGTVSILLGNGDGTFQPAVNYPAGYAPASVAVGDFNGDGKLDLAVANFGIPCCSGPRGSVAILLGNGDGTFQPPSHYAAGSNPLSIATADFNNDGKLDLAVSTDYSGVQVLLGNGDGTFQPAVRYNVPAYAASLAIADFNNDGKPDLAVADTAGVFDTAGERRWDLPGGRELQHRVGSQFRGGGGL